MLQLYFIRLRYWINCEKRRVDAAAQHVCPPRVYQQVVWGKVGRGWCGVSDYEEAAH